LGSALRFGGGSAPAGNTNTVTNNAPWSGEQQYLTDIYAQAQNLDQNNVPQYYPGDTYAPLTGQQQGLMSNLIGQTSGGGTTALQGANSTLTGTLSPGYTAQTEGTFGNANSTINNELSSSYLNPANSPAYATAMSNALATAVPAATAGFVNGNRSDSGLASAAAASGAANAAGGLAQQQYDVNQGVQNQAASLGSQNLLTQENQQNQASLYAPMVDQESLNNLTTGLNTAGMNQTNAQNQLNANIAAYNYGQMLPWNQLGLYEGAVTGTGNPGGSSSTTQPYFNNSTANTISAAEGIGSIGLMAALAFSDRDLKTDIHKIGRTDSDFPLYTFRYIWEGPMSQHIGVMAQDVLKKRPEAVVYTPLGMMVDYTQALAA
jgi:hypothetical protein